MTAAALLIALENYLGPLALALSGNLSVAETEFDVMTALAQDPEEFRVVLSCNGDEAIDGNGRSGAVIGKFSVYVQSPLGFGEEPQQSLHRTTSPTGTAFLERLHAIIKLVRAATLDYDEADGQANFNYRGWHWLKYEDSLTWRTAVAEFELLFVHDDPTLDAAPLTVTLGSPMHFEKVGAYLHVTVDGVTTRIRLLDIPA